MESYEITKHAAFKECLRLWASENSFIKLHIWFYIWLYSHFLLYTCTYIAYADTHTT